jgi:hypothetical protein
MKDYPLYGVYCGLIVPVLRSPCLTHLMFIHLQPFIDSPAAYDIYKLVQQL